jgi:hypothetical protein
MSKQFFVSVFFIFLVTVFNINAQKVYLSLPDNLSEEAGKQISIPLDVNTESATITSFNLKITYDPEIFVIDTINSDNGLGLGSICNPKKGDLRIGYMNLKGFKGKGALLTLKGHTIAGGTSDIIFADGLCVFNNNVSFKVPKQGKITVVDSLSKPPTWTAAGAAYMLNVTLTEKNQHKFTYKAVAAAGVQVKYQVTVNKNQKPVTVKWISIDPKSGELTINAPAGSAGTYTIGVSANDGKNKSVLAPISVLTVNRKSTSKK